MNITKLTALGIKRVHVFAITIAMIVALLTAGLQLANAAGAATISFSPGSGSYEVGQTFSVNVAVNNGAVATATAQVIVNYDTSKLQLTNLATASEPFETQFGSATTGGTIDVTRASLNGDVTGSNNFMRLTFKALSAGSSSMTVASGSSILKADDSSQIWNEVQTSATYTVTTPATPTPTPTPTTPSNPTPTSPSTPTSETPATPTTPTDNTTETPENSSQDQNPIETNPSATGVLEEEPQVAERKLKKAVITLRTKKPVTAKILYGVDGQLISSTPESELSTQQRISLDPALLVAGRTYSYKVVLTDEGGNVTETETKTFRAAGYKLRLVLEDADGNPLARIKVQLRSEPREGTTGDDGIVEFEDVELGDHTAYYSVNGNDQQQTLSVVDNAILDEDGEESVPLQSITLVATSTTNIVPFVVSGLSLLLFAVIGAVIFKRVRSDRQQAFAGGNYQGANNVTGDRTQNQLSDSAFTEKDKAESDYLRPAAPEVNKVIEPNNQDQEQ